MALGSTSSFFSAQHEQFLIIWDRDIQRASEAGAKRITGTREDAEDFAQEARIRLFRIASKPQAAASRYVRKVIANAIKTAIDHTGPSLEAINEETQHIAAEQPDQRIAEVDAWLQTISPHLRTIYHYLYVDGRTQRETARLMHISQPRVAQLHSRLLETGRRDLRHLAA
jgi:RNA polymerase sigma factor (sigma-70 family)